MTALHFVDLFDPTRDTDCLPQVVQIYRNQFPDLYRAIDRSELKTSTGSSVTLGGDTLITYRSAIQRIYGKAFRFLDSTTQKDIRSALDTYSNTTEKRIQYWDGEVVINNHQIGNMMPFPSDTPSLNSLRADVVNIPTAQRYDYYRDLRQQFFGDNEGKPLVTERLYDYFDRFLAEVKKYYAESADFRPKSELQLAIYYQRGYFDFFQTYDKFVEYNLLHDFVGKDLWAITDFREYLQVANEIIDSRGKRFTASAEQH
ncbi:hypothetical protein GALL_101190 [mine drainage metagenome]|uniref:Uncharacterized protein n=1 Tax=mine drainage metagenome TaxID=410659 RepID=A0A1J5SUZ2_9ZZZZ